VAISWNVKSSSRMRDSWSSEKQTTNSVHGLLDTQIFALEQEARVLDNFNEVLTEAIVLVESVNKEAEFGGEIP
jgi:hypothetical protein